jgi:two-component system nitrate/nitrite response regulator NarL
MRLAYLLSGVVMSSWHEAGNVTEESPRDSLEQAVNVRRARIFLLSDIRLYREGLLVSLVRRNVFDVLGAHDLSEAIVPQISLLHPDAIILDMSSKSGFEMARLLNTHVQAAKIIAFGVSEVDDLVLACAKAGVAGYVAPSAGEEDLENAIKSALRGELYCSPRIAGFLFRRAGSQYEKTVEISDRDTLTLREREIMNLVSEGRSNKEIARTLRISNATVKNHVHNILEKLRVRRRGEAAACVRAAQTQRQFATENTGYSIPTPAAAAPAIQIASAE